MAGIRDLLVSPEEGQVAQGNAIMRSKQADYADTAVAGAGITAGAIGAKARSMVDAAKAAGTKAMEYGRSVKDGFTAPTPPVTSPSPAGDPMAARAAMEAPSTSVPAARPQVMYGTPSGVALSPGDAAGEAAARAASPRVSAVTPGGASAVPPGQQVVPYDPVRANAPGAPRELSFSDPAQQAYRSEQNARIRASNNPHLATPGGQAAVQNAQRIGSGVQPAAQPMATAAEVVAPKPGMLRSAWNTVGKWGSRAAVAGGVLSAADAADKASTGDTVEQRQEEADIRAGVKGIDAYGRAGTPDQRRFMAGARGAMAEYGDNMLLGYGRELGTGLGAGAAAFVRPPAGTPSGIMGRLGAAKTGFGQGWDDAAAAEAGLQGSAVVPPGNQPSAQAPATAPQPTFQPQLGGTGRDVEDGRVPTLRAGRISPEQVISGGSDETPVSGVGVIKRTTRGNEGPAKMVDSRPSLREAEAKTAAGKPKMSGAEALGRMQGKLLDEGSARADMNTAAKVAAANLAVRKYGDERGDKNRANIESQIGAYAEANSKATNDVLPGGMKRADYVKQDAANVRKAMEYSLGNRDDGKTMEQLSAAETQQLLQAHKMKGKLEASRSGFAQNLRDYTGNKRADSDDLYSYLPASVEPATLAGSGRWLVKMANGNTMDIKEAAGGKFNFSGPNTPIDADAMQMIQPLIDKYRKEKGAK